MSGLGMLFAALGGYAQGVSEYDEREAERRRKAAEAEEERRFREKLLSKEFANSIALKQMDYAHESEIRKEDRAFQVDILNRQFGNQMYLERFKHENQKELNRDEQNFTAQQNKEAWEHQQELEAIKARNRAEELRLTHDLGADTRAADIESKRAMANYYNSALIPQAQARVEKQEDENRIAESFERNYIECQLGNPDACVAATGLLQVAKLRAGKFATRSATSTTNDKLTQDWMKARAKCGQQYTDPNDVYNCMANVDKAYNRSSNVNINPEDPAAVRHLIGTILEGLKQNSSLLKK